MLFSTVTHPNLDQGAFKLLTCSHLKLLRLNLTILLVYSSKPPITYIYLCSVKKLVILEKKELKSDYFCSTIDISQFLPI